MPPKKGHEKILQFKIILTDPIIQPPIWRRIQLKMANTTFRDLHKAISISMGWFEAHHHEFRFPSGLRIGIKNTIERDTKSEKRVKLSTYFKEEGTSFCQYEYDFGDGWIHHVVLEKVMTAKANVTYPICVGGKRACPPEDCGGPDGYAELLKTLAKPAYQLDRDELEKLEWLMDHPYGYAGYDPDKFDPSAVNWEERLGSLGD